VKGAAGSTAVDSRRALPRSFYQRDVAVVARAMLGTILEFNSPGGCTAGRVVETEAYLGPSDPASHAVVGLTDRTRDLFGRPGTSYVYFIYGVHWCFNAVAWRQGGGAAVLVRALEPLEGLPLMRARRWPRRGPSVRASARRDRDLTNGPGKLCEALGIDRRQSGLSLQRLPLILRRGREIPDGDVLVSPRIGISRAVDSPYRYFVRNNEFVSGGTTGVKNGRG
jgi:DNA-3-methyladenine glycosylase